MPQQVVKAMPDSTVDLKVSRVVAPEAIRNQRHLAWANVMVHNLVSKPVPPTMLVHMQTQYLSTN